MVLTCECDSQVQSVVFHCDVHRLLQKKKEKQIKYTKSRFQLGASFKFMKRITISLLFISRKSQYRSGTVNLNTVNSNTVNLNTVNSNTVKPKFN